MRREGPRGALWVCLTTSGHHRPRPSSVQNYISCTNSHALHNPKEIEEATEDNLLIYMDTPFFSEPFPVPPKSSHHYPHMFRREQSCSHGKFVPVLVA